MNKNHGYTEANFMTETVERAPYKKPYLTLFSQTPPSTTVVNRSSSLPSSPSGSISRKSSPDSDISNKGSNIKIVVVLISCIYIIAI